MELPKDYRYSKDHEWVCDQGDGSALVGITHYAQDALGDIVFVELPALGAELQAEDDFGVVESVKTVSDLYAPLSGEVIAVNEDLEDAPELVNESPYEKGWIVRVKISDPSELESLMDAAGYQAFLNDGES
ncbi:glycine cleavage system protein GcvH [Lujinxingia litoralis]|uniref:Glycine cleavage system H protein n=1 Tax=Lujinxingia litoralis TaxID=2211119 RepID=A0A328C9A9_9DELT|nr:glycine cleavage system protein GcvH [Lujinxingia litoralis]RAL23574.1 glycine cleavage system protein GcvH [Lujinxingia litoralis]